jgi:hypothetical protein
MTPRDMAFIMKRNECTLRKYMLRKGIDHKSITQIPTEHKEYILANYKSMTLRSMAENLGRTLCSVAGYCNREGLTKHKETTKRKEVDKPYTRPDNITTPHQAHVHQVIGTWSF